MKLSRLDALEGVEGAIRFFSPTTTFVQWMKEEYKKIRIYDVGAGDGHAVSELSKAGMNVMGLDVMKYETPVHNVLHADGEEFEYDAGSVVMICRPCHGAFIDNVFEQAEVRQVKDFLYVGLKRNKESDLGQLPAFELVLQEAGEDGECVWRRHLSHKKMIKVSLVKFEASYGQTDWRQDAGENWKNMAGGWCPKHADDVVLETAEIEAGDWASLDYTKTTLLRNNQTQYGWLAPDGTWYGCETWAHDSVAELIIKKPLVEVEKTYVRVRPYAGETYAAPVLGRLTAEQKNWLLMNGHALEEEDDGFL